MIENSPSTVTFKKFKIDTVEECERIYTSMKSGLIEISEGLFPPPWNMNEHPEKTEGWIEFQKAMRQDPKFYGVQLDKSASSD